MHMSTENKSKLSFVSAIVVIVVSVCAAFIVGAILTDRLEDAQSCHVSIDGSENGSTLNAKLKIGGDSAACALMAQSLQSLVNNNSDDQDDDSAASDADAASAPVGASQ
jgi:hypothetical protein